MLSVPRLMPCSVKQVSVILLFGLTAMIWQVRWSLLRIVCAGATTGTAQIFGIRTLSWRFWANADRRVSSAMAERVGGAGHSGLDSDPADRWGAGGEAVRITKRCG